MRAILGLAVVPIIWAWSILERRIWLSMISLAALSGVTYLLKQPTITAILVCFIAILLMRIDGLEAKAAAKTAE